MADHSCSQPSEDVHDDGLSQILDFVEDNLPSELKYRAYTPVGRFSFGFDEFQLRVKVDLSDIILPVSCRLEHFELPEDISLSICASLRQLAVNEIIKTKGLLTASTAGKIVLRILEASAVHIRGIQCNPNPHGPDFKPQTITKKAVVHEKKLWKLNDIKDINAILLTGEKMDGVDLDSVEGMATHILGKSPAEICNDILPQYRILHCENILRKDLQNKFLQAQAEMRAKLMKEDISNLRKCVPPENRRCNSNSTAAAMEQLVEYLVKPRITFQGTRREVVPSIVQHGFLRPGEVNPVTKKPLPIYNGSAYGQGIYSSPEPWYALLYSEPSEEGNKTRKYELPGLKLIVCATIMGRAAVMSHDDHWYDQTKPYPDWTGKDEATVWHFVSSLSSDKPSVRRKNYDMSNYEFSGDKMRKKQALMAKGQKFFAYGFGSHGGKNIVIEDVAEVSDGEEEYGEYQGDKQDIKERNPNFWNWGELEGETAHDEYTQARKSKINRR